MKQALVIALPLSLMTAGCQQGQVVESNQAAIVKSAKALEKAGDAAVDQTIAEIARNASTEEDVPQTFHNVSK